MQPEDELPQINISKIKVSGGIAGLFFTLIGMATLLIGVPMLRYLFAGAMILGGAVALALHFRRHKTPGAPCVPR
jgi:hypothetical protein